MTWILLLTVAALFAAVVLIELRAVRAGDERAHHAPGYALVIGGLVAIVAGIAMAMLDDVLWALLLATVGLTSVGFGTTRGVGHIGTHPGGHLH